MDLTPSLVPNSAQVNADDLIAGPITVTISEVSKGNAEQPFFFNLVEFPDRSYRPSKSMRRIIVQCWGPEATTYAGRKLTLYRNPDITFGKDRVGGIEISHASHIAGPVTLALTVSRGKRKDFTVKPLAEAVVLGRDWGAELVKAGNDIANVTALGKAAADAGAPESTLAKIRARYNELKAQ